MPKPGQRKRPSPKQDAVAAILAANGVSNRAAVEQVYDMDPEAASASTTVAILANNPAVLLATDREKMALQVATARDSATERAIMAERLRGMALENEGVVALKAIDMYSRIPHVDLYREHGTQADEPVTAADLAEQLRVRLLALLAQPAAGDTVLDIVREPEGSRTHETTIDIPVESTDR